MNKFSQKLKELRLEAHLSQAELAQKMGVGQNTVSTWELGARQPDYDTLIKLAKYFEVSTDYLLGVVD